MHTLAKQTLLTTERAWYGLSNWIV